MERRLAAILAADVVGYTRLMGADEAGTLARLKALREELIDPEIAEHSGRVVKLMGDGVLVEFASVVDAMRCAARIQQGMAARNADQPRDRRIEFRIGINLGDVIVEGDDIYGDGVNVAARLEGLAEPGGICVSDKVYEEVEGKLELGFEDLGEQEVKNIAKPLRIYRAELEPAQKTDGTPQPSAPREGVLDRPAVAVLPFTNMSGDPEQEYFADGITEDIITGLCYWRCFPVISRNSTYVYKGQARDVTQVATDLGARYVLEGSVRKVGNRVRISAQLIDAATGHHIWARRYDRDLGDVFDLQDEITERIVASIEPELTRAEYQRTLRKKPENLDAWDYSLRALTQQEKFTRNGHSEARRLLLKAVELDPTSGHALSMLALCRYHETIFGWAEDRSQALVETLQAAERAVALDDGDWLAHAMLGMGHLWSEREHDRAVDELDCAVALNPSSATAHHFHSCVLEFSGRSAESIPRLHTVMRLDPRYRFMSAALADLALSHLQLGQFEDAVEFAEKAVRALPNNVRAYQRLAAIQGHLGHKEEAQSALDKLLQLQPDFSMAYIDTTYPYKESNNRDLLVEGLRKAGWPA